MSTNLIRFSDRKSVIATVFLFVLVNTHYLWEGKLGLLSLPTMLILVIVFIALTAKSLSHLLSAYKEGFKNRNRVNTIALMGILLTLVAIKPNGLISFNTIYGEGELVAGRKGVANCTTTLQLTSKGHFRYRDICFGISDITGSYMLRNDSLFFFDISRPFFNNDSFYEFAILEPSPFPKRVERLIMFKSERDEYGFPLKIFKNELIKPKPY